MKVIYIVPANIKDDGSYHYSSFLKTELFALKESLCEVKPFFFTKRNSLIGFLKSLNELNQMIKNFQPDLIHVNYGSSTSFLVLLAQKKCPWIISFGGSELLGHPNKGIIWRLREIFAKNLSKISAFYADKIICVSNNLKQELKEKTQQKVSIIPRGVNINLFINKDKIGARKELGVSNDEKVVIFSLPRLNAGVKNLELAQRTISILEKKYKIKLIILNNYTQTEIIRFLEAGDCLLVTSKHEGSPNIVKESMCMNLPIVSVDCGDVKERLKNVSNSYISESYDEIELAKLVEKALEIGMSNGREIIIKDGIDLNSTTNKIINIYSNINSIH